MGCQFPPSRGARSARSPEAVLVEPGACGGLGTSVLEGARGEVGRRREPDEMPAGS